MMERQEIIDRNPLVPFLEGRGFNLRGSGPKMMTNRCAVKEHKPGHNCMEVYRDTQKWHCHDCGVGGTIIDFLLHADGIATDEAFRRLGGETTPPTVQRAPAPIAANGNGKPKMVKAYDYKDENGKLLFQVCRFDPKDFRQRAPDGNGAWIYKLEGIRRVLYNLPTVMAAGCVFICEGEKDADTLTACGLTATTNCGGAKKWDATYSQALKNKEVTLLPDSDKAGAEHAELLKSELSKVAKSIRVVTMPDGYKDVSEYREAFDSHRDFGTEILDLMDKAEVLYRGESIPVQTMAELEEEYREHIKLAATQQFLIGSWLPSLKYCVRALVPGELASVLAATGVGKTMILQNIALHTDLSTLLFETELPGTLSFERFAAMVTKRSGRSVASSYEVNGSVDWKHGGRTDHIACCHKSNLTTEQIAKIIKTAEWKTGRRPRLVLIDYVQLVKGSGEGRYERTSGVAEELKVIAKETETIIIMASQIGRAATGRQKQDEGPQEVCLTDGKDSGSIENSSGLVLGAWRDADPDRMIIRVLKNTKGITGKTVACRISESLLIHEETNQPEP